MANPLTDKQFVRLLDKRLTDVAVGAYEGLPMIIDKLFKVMPSKKAWEEFMAVSGVGDPEAFNGMIQYQGAYPGYTCKITPTEYAGGITIQRRLLDTDQYDVIEELASGLGEAANRKRNKIAHEPFIYFDSAAFNYLYSEEGVALCSNSHTTKVPNVSTSAGFDNLLTLAFDADNLEAARILSKGFKSDIGERIQTNFDTIIHGTNLAADVWEVLNSQGKTGTANNDANFQKGRWKSIELPLLDDYDTNDWFIVDSAMMKKQLIWVDGVKPEFNSTTDFDTLVRKYASYFVCGWGFRDWRFIVGSSVS